MYPSLQIGHMLVPTFSVMLGVGVILLMLVALLRSKKCKLDKRVTAGAILAGLAAGVIGTVAAEWLFDSPGQMHPGTGEVAVGWIAAAVGIKAWSDARRANIRQLADCIAPPLALFLMVMGTASFLAGCDFGQPTDAPWGVTFTNGLALAWYGTPLGTPLQPTQLYESVLAAGILAFLIVWERRRPPAGTLFLAFVVTYAAGRFLLEFVRGEAGRGFLWLLSIPQWLCLATLAACAAARLSFGARRRVQALLASLRGLHRHPPRTSTQHH